MYSYHNMFSTFVVSKCAIHFDLVAGELCKLHESNSWPHNLEVLKTIFGLLKVLPSRKAGTNSQDCIVQTLFSQSCVSYLICEYTLGCCRERKICWPIVSKYNIYLLNKKYLSLQSGNFEWKLLDRRYASLLRKVLSSLVVILSYLLVETLTT